MTSFAMKDFWGSNGITLFGLGQRKNGILKNRPFFPANKGCIPKYWEFFCRLPLSASTIEWSAYNSKAKLRDLIFLLRNLAFLWPFIRSFLGFCTSVLLSGFSLFSEEKTRNLFFFWGTLFRRYRRKEETQIGREVWMLRKSSALFSVQRSRRIFLTVLPKQ